MNKHLIILPILLASAISLHVMSFYLEEPEQIVANNPIITQSSEPSPITSSLESNVPSGSPSDSASIAPEGSVTPEPNKSIVPSTSSVKSPAQQKSASLAAPSTSATSVAVVKTPVPVKAIPVASNVPVATPVPSAVVVQVASAYIKPKDTNDIIKEARMTGGRVDPFLSLRPPDITALPELPVIEKPDIKVTKLTKTNGSKSGSLVIKNGVYTLPPTIKKKKSGKQTGFYKTPDITGDIIPSVEPTQKPEDIIELRVKDRMDKNLTLTGIITGNKRFAIISVKGSDGSESRVVSVGEEVTTILGTKIKLIAISTSANTVTVSSTRNSVILRMKESN